MRHRAKGRPTLKKVFMKTSLGTKRLSSRPGGQVENQRLMVTALGLDVSRAMYRLGDG